MKRCFFVISVFCVISVKAQMILSPNDIEFKSIPRRWIDGVPLGNGLIGAMVWQEGSNIRLSLDNAMLWSGLKGFNEPSYKTTFNWIYEQVLQNNKDFLNQTDDTVAIQEKIMLKRAAGALLLKMPPLKAKIKSCLLSLKDASCNIKWDNKMEMKIFVHATDPVGWFIIRNPIDKINPQFDFPYQPVPNKNFGRAKFNKPVVKKGQNEYESVFEYRDLKNFSYMMVLNWTKDTQGNIVGVWSVTKLEQTKYGQMTALEYAREAMMEGYDSSYEEHVAWWNNFWSASKISIPDKKIEKQYYRDMYKVGSIFRKYSIPPSLQAVWTADDITSYPENADYQNLMNTNLMIEPLFKSNHVDLSEVYLDWLWSVKENFRKFTYNFYERAGLGAPAVSDIDGNVSLYDSDQTLSASTISWMSYWFYKYWRYTGDEDFLENRTYPWMLDVSVFMDLFTKRQGYGGRVFSLSNELTASDYLNKQWIRTISNYDLSLTKNFFKKTSELAYYMEDDSTSRRNDTIAKAFPNYYINKKGGFGIAPGHEFKKSTKNLGHLMPVFPLGDYSWEEGELQKKVIKTSIKEIDSLGYNKWTGYTYAWYSNILARSGDGAKTNAMLSYFVDKHTGPNSLHINRNISDTNNGKFTLDGNMLFANAVQEMLMQDHDGVIRIFPAVPKEWKNVSFSNFRADGNILVSAEMQNGKITEIKLNPQQDAVYTIQFTKDIEPVKEEDWDMRIIDVQKDYTRITFKLVKGEEVILK